MNGPGVGPDRRLSLDIAVPAHARDGAEVLRRGWNAQFGDAIPLPPVTPTRGSDYRLRIQHANVDDAIIETVHSESLTGGTGGDYGHHSDRVVLHVVQQGQWHFTATSGNSTVTVRAGQFVVRNNNSPWQFAVGPHTKANLLVLPVAQLRPYLGDRPVVGSADSPELRLLAAHMRLTDTMLDELSPAGAQAARAALVELVKGVITQGIDGGEPLFAAALAQAARDFMDEHLTDPELTPSVLARELNVSVRTLQRAFATTQESITGYIRRRRLEAARLDLSTGNIDRPNVAALAARWHFADNSHFSRAFKNRYGQTPTEFARSIQCPAGELKPPTRSQAP